jgi:hypothetical protein
MPDWQPSNSGVNFWRIAITMIAMSASVEIKFLLAGANASRALELFDMGKPPSVRAVAFFDTAGLALFRGDLSHHKDLKVILRARTRKDKKMGITTVKLRTTEGLSDGLQSDESVRAKREFDYAFGRSVLDSYSLEDEVDASEAEKVFHQKRAISKIFSKAQEELLDEMLGPDLDWANLRIFGPVEGVRVWEDVPIDRFGMPLTIEIWELPTSAEKSANTLLEVSTRTPFAESITQTIELLKILQDNHLEPIKSGTKTQTVLEHFRAGSNV